MMEQSDDAQSRRFSDVTLKPAGIVPKRRGERVSKLAQLCNDELWVPQWFPTATLGVMRPAVVDRVGMVWIEIDLGFLFVVRIGHLQLLPYYWQLLSYIDGIPCHRQETKRFLLCHEVWSCFCCSSAPS